MNKFSKVFAMIFMSLFLVSVASAACENGCSINTMFKFESTSANTLTVTQGDSVNLILLAYSHGQQLTLEKLVSLPSTTILEEHKTGIPQGFRTYLYDNTYSLNTNALTTGTHTLRFLASNGYESEHSELTLIILPKNPFPDMKKPIVNIINPIATTYGSHRTEMTFNVFDENLKSCVYSLNGVSQVSIPGIVNGEKTVSGFTSVIGSNTWTVTCRDEAGNVGSDSVTFNVKLPVVDDIKPIVKITNPISGTIYDSHRTEMTFNVFDENLDYCLYGLVSLASIDISGVENGENTILGISSNEGINMWSVVCVDKSGNVGSDTVVFTVKLPVVDETDPIVKITEPVDGATYNSQKEFMNFDLIEDNLDYCVYSLNGIGADVELEHAGTNTINQIISVVGVNTWSVTCYDKSGNMGMDSVTFTVEELTPEDNLTLTPLNPSEGEEFEEDEKIIFKAQTNKDAIVTYSVDGESTVVMTKVSNFIFNSNKRSFKEGNHKVTFCATSGEESVCEIVKFKVKEKECEDDCETCPNRRESNEIREVISSDKNIEETFVNKPIYLEEESEQATIRVTFGEQMFYGIIALILLMMVLTVIMFIAEQKMK